jgi:hypothetical protein
MVPLFPSRPVSRRPLPKMINPVSLMLLLASVAAGAGLVAAWDWKSAERAKPVYQSHAVAVVTPVDGAKTPPGSPEWAAAMKTCQEVARGVFAGEPRPEGMHLARCTFDAGKGRFTAVAEDEEKLRAQLAPGVALDEVRSKLRPLTGSGGILKYATVTEPGVSLKPGPGVRLFPAVLAGFVCGGAVFLGLLVRQLLIVRKSMAAADRDVPPPAK